MNIPKKWRRIASYSAIGLTTIAVVGGAYLLINSAATGDPATVSGPVEGDYMGGGPSTYPVSLPVITAAGKDNKPFSIGGWSKYVDNQLAWYVQDEWADYRKDIGLGADGVSSEDLAYLYINERTGSQFQVPAYEKYPDEESVDAVAKTIITELMGGKEKKVYRSAGTRFDHGWGLGQYIEIPNESIRASADFDYTKFIFTFSAKQLDSGNWIAGIVDTEQYIRILLESPDNFIEQIVKEDLAKEYEQNTGRKAPVISQPVYFSEKN